MSGKRKDWCKHYRGMHLKSECEAGVRFDSLPNHGTRQFHDTCPCFGADSGCNLAEYRTAEEVAADDAALAKRFEAMVAARSAIVDSLGGPWKRGTTGAGGVIDCPVCSAPKSLRFSRAGVNGHIHAACSTDGCVRWME